MSIQPAWTRSLPADGSITREQLADNATANFVRHALDLRSSATYARAVWAPTDGAEWEMGLTVVGFQGQDHAGTHGMLGTAVSGTEDAIMSFAANARDVRLALVTSGVLVEASNVLPENGETTTIFAGMSGGQAYIRVNGAVVASAATSAVAGETPKSQYINFQGLSGRSPGCAVYDVTFRDLADDSNTLVYRCDEASGPFENSYALGPTRSATVTGSISQVIVASPAAGPLVPVPVDVGALMVPSPFAPAVTPRLYAVANNELSLYPSSLHSSLAAMVYDIDDGSGLGKQQSERYVINSATTGAGTLSVAVHDPNTLETRGSGTYALKVISQTAGTGETRRVLCIGDSTTAAGAFTARLLALNTAEPDQVQITLAGTLGSGSNLHEGRSGWSVARYFEPTTQGDVDSNPFVATLGGKFNAASWVSGAAHSSGAQTAPEIVVWHLGINDVFTKTTDAEVNAVMDTFLDRLDRMIGRVADATVGSWSEVSPGIKHIVCVPIAPAGTQDAFGDDYGTQYHRARYVRNHNVAAHRIIEHFSGAEGAGVYLCPWNAAVDPVNGFAFDAAAPANIHTTRTVERQNNGVHPATSGYNQMGDMLWAFLNGLVADGLA